MRLGAAQQEAFDFVGTRAHREQFQRGQRCRIVAAFGLNQEVSQDFAQQQIAVAVFHRFGARSQPGLMRKSGEQPLREGVDGVDPEAPARAIEDARKQAAGALSGFGT